MKKKGDVSSDDPLTPAARRYLEDWFGKKRVATMVFIVSEPLPLFFVRRLWPKDSVTL